VSVKVWFLNLIGFLVLASVIGVVCARAYYQHSIPGEIVDPRFDSNQGFRDFHNAVYYPVRAFLTGVNPYSAEYQSFHPDGRGFPLFAPTTLLIHAPFGFLQLKYAEIAFAASNFALVIWICVLIFRYSRVSNSFCFGSVAILAALIIFCRPGLLNFYGMQITLLHVLGCLWALEYADEYPFLSGVGLMLASCKPTYAIPLAILMFFRGDFRAVLWGAILSALASCVVVVIIAANCGGLESFVEQVNAQYFAAAEHPEIPEVATSWTRLDAYSVIPRWTEVPAEWNLNVWIPVLMIVFGAICMLFERDKSQRVGSISRSGMLAMLIILTSIYHQAYDALLLWVPIAAIAINAPKLDRAFSWITQMLLAVLMLIPMYNFFGTQMLINKTEIEPSSVQWKIVVTVNAIAVLIAALLVGLRIMYSSFSKVDRNEE